MLVFGTNHPAMNPAKLEVANQRADSPRTRGREPTGKDDGRFSAPCLSPVLLLQGRRESHRCRRHVPITVYSAPHLRFELWCLHRQYLLPTTQEHRRHSDLVPSCTVRLIEVDSCTHVLSRYHLVISVGHQRSLSKQGKNHTIHSA